VGAGAANFGGLVGAFHDLASKYLGICDPTQLKAPGNPLLHQKPPAQSMTYTVAHGLGGLLTFRFNLWITVDFAVPQRTIRPLLEELFHNER
jgi:hypothetical protein